MDRYEENPVYYFFDGFVVATIGELPQSMEDKYNSLLNTEGDTWKSKVKEMLNLSETIEIAILDLWYRNSEILSKRGEVYEPVHFAINFVENYYKENSQIDVWEGNALDLAKQRIVSYQKNKHH
jgi:hypothetical protein